MSSYLPSLVSALVTNYEAWIVGSAADPQVTNPRDYDVVVPFSSWNKAVHLIPKDAKLNSFGGLKVTQPDCETDVWAGELSFVMCNNKAKWAWQPHLNVRMQKMT